MFLRGIWLKCCDFISLASFSRNFKFQNRLCVLAPFTKLIIHSRPLIVKRFWLISFTLYCLISTYQRLFAIANSSITPTKVHSMTRRRTKQTYRDRAKQQKTQPSPEEAFAAMAIGQTHNEVHKTTFRFLYSVVFQNIKI